MKIGVSPKRKKVSQLPFFRGELSNFPGVIIFIVVDVPRCWKKNGSYVGDPLKVAEIYNPYIRGFG